MIRKSKNKTFCFNGKTVTVKRGIFGAEIYSGKNAIALIDFFPESKRPNVVLLDAAGDVLLTVVVDEQKKIAKIKFDATLQKPHYNGKNELEIELP